MRLLRSGDFLASLQPRDLYGKEGHTKRLGDGLPICHLACSQYNLPLSMAHLAYSITTVTLCNSTSAGCSFCLRSHTHLFAHQSTGQAHPSDWSLPSSGITSSRRAQWSICKQTAPQYSRQSSVSTMGTWSSILGSLTCHIYLQRMRVCSSIIVSRPLISVQCQKERSREAP